MRRAARSAPTSLRRSVSRVWGPATVAGWFVARRADTPASRGAAMTRASCARAPPSRGGGRRPPRLAGGLPAADDPGRGAGARRRRRRAATAAAATGFTLAHFAAFARRADEWLALWRTLWISAASVRAGGADRGAAGVHLRAQRVPRPPPARRPDRPAGGAAAAGGGDRLPLPLRRERLRLARRPGRPRPGRAALAAGRAGRHPARPRLLDVRLLLPLHPRRPGPPRRRRCWRRPARSAPARCAPSGGSPCRCSARRWPAPRCSPS